MKEEATIKTTEAITNLGGKPLMLPIIKDGVKVEGTQPLTLRWVFTSALVGDSPKDEDGVVRLRKAILAEKIELQAEVVLTVDERALLIDVVKKSMAPVPLLRAMEILDPEEVKRLRV